MNIRYLILIVVFGLCSANLSAAAAGPDLDSARQGLIETYQDITSVYYEADWDDEDRIEQYAVRNDGVCAHRSFILSILIDFHGFDPVDAHAVWKDVAADFIFFDGKRTTISSSGLDRYIVREQEAYPKPWGANPMHACPWPMIAGWAETGMITEREAGGWVLKAPDRHLWIAFDEQMRVVWVEHKYELDSLNYTRWSFSGYEGQEGDPLFPTRRIWSVKHFDQDGEVRSEYVSEAVLKFDPERAEEALPFRRPDGTVNLMSPNEAKIRRTARESGRTLKAVMNAPACGPLDLGFERYDPETGDLFSDDGKLMYNLKDLQRQAEAELEAQN